MNNTTSIFRRLLCGALAMIMVLGYVPVGASAEEPAEAAAPVLQAVMTRTEETVENPEGEPAEITQYTYTVSASGTAATGAVVDWGTTEGVVDGSLVTTAASASATVKANGLVLPVSYGTVATWNAEILWNDVAAGAALAAPSVSYQDCGISEDAAWTTALTDAEGNAVEAGLAVTAAMVGKQFNAVMTLMYKGAAVTTLEKTISATYAAAEYTFSHASGWYTEIPEVTVTAKTAADVSLIAPVSVNGNSLGTSAWAAAGEGTYTVTIPGKQEASVKTISVGGQTVELKVDTVAPAVGEVGAKATNDGTHIAFRYRTGESGGTLVITDGVSTVTRTAEVGTVEFVETIDSVKFAGTVTVTLTNGAGVTASGSGEVFGLPVVAVKSGIIGAKDSKNIVTNSGKIYFKAEYLTPGDATWSVSSKGESVEFVYNEDRSIAIDVPKDAPFENLLVKVTDSSGRTGSMSFGAFGFDNVAPEVSLTEGTLYAEKTYVKETETYSFELTDDLLTNEFSSKVWFYREGSDEPVKEITFVGGQASYTVEDGQYVHRIVAKVYDAAGNVTEKEWFPNIVVDTTKPSISAEIIAYAKDENGIYSEQIAPSAVIPGSDYMEYTLVGHQDSVQVRIKYTMEEANLNDGSWSWNASANKWTKIETIVVNKNDSYGWSLNPMVIDMAGNRAESTMNVSVKGYTMTVSTNGGVLTINTGKEEEIKRNYSISLSDSELKADLNGTTIYKDTELTYTVTIAGAVTDMEAQVEVIGGDGKVTVNGGTFDVVGGTATFNVNVEAGVEVKSFDLCVKAWEKGTGYNQTEKTFKMGGADTKAPAVTIAVESTGEMEVVEGVRYFTDPVTVKFGMTDMLSAHATITYKVDGVEGTITLPAEEGADIITVDAGQKLTDLKVFASDNAAATAENPAVNSTTSFASDSSDIEVDGAAPVASVKVAQQAVAEAEGIQYYNDVVTIVFEVTDNNLKEASFEWNNNGTSYKKTGADMTISEDGKTWTYELVVEKDQHITDVKLTTVDKAGNTADASFDAVVVDATAPVVNVTRELLDGAKHIETRDGVAYYNGAVKYTVTVSDNYLDDTKTTISINGAEMPVTKTGDKTAMDGDSIVAEFTVTDGAALEQIVVVTADMVGASATSANVSDTDITFTSADDTLTYTGPKVIVDSINPAISGVISVVDKDGKLVPIDKYESFSQGGNYYLIFKETYEETESDEENADERIDGTVTATVVFTLTEANPDEQYLAANGWKYKDGVYTWTKSITVNEKSTDVLKVANLSAMDYADRLPDATIDVVTQSNGGSSEFSQVIQINPAPAEGGTSGIYNEDIYIDRCTPIDQVNPDNKHQITIAGTSSPAKKNQDGLDVYQGRAVTFTLNAGDDHSGLKEVVAKVTGASVKDKTVTFNDEGKAYVTVTIPAGTETNDISLTLRVSDKVGNTYIFSKKFGLDDHAPVVTVTFDELRATNERYFNEERTATVIIEDLNLPSQDTVLNNIKINTDVPASTVFQSGISYTIVYHYTTDGEYKLIVDEASADLAGNTAAIVYNGDAWNDFEIDMTAPIIKVGYSRTPDGMDGNIHHYAENLHVNITIQENNFDASIEAPKVVFNPTRQGLSHWTSDGDNHRASVTFPEGNNYDFTVDYTDLAGNPAKSFKNFTFCVDTHAPTIDITKGDLTTKELNVLQGDLSLGFTINDKEENLSDYKVTVTHLDNNFKKSTVSGKEYYTITTVEDRTTVYVDFDKIAKEKGKDGLYSVDITARDYAGNYVTLPRSLEFSLNRFGSSFTSNDPFTLDFLTPGSDGNAYHDTVSNKLVIQEINPNQVWQDSSKKAEGSVLTVVVNGTSTKLVEGEHYTMTVSREGTGSNKWYVYTYQIDPSTFKNGDATVDGRYSILIYGEDEAGNKNTNESNEYGSLQQGAEGDYSGKIEFVLDSTAPIITTTGIESGKIYNAEAQKLEIYLTDNTPAGVTVYLNEVQIALSESMEGLADNQAWLVYNAENGSYILNVPEENSLFDGQDIRIVATDAAGNVAEEDITDFNISTNLFVRLLNNIWFMGGIGLLALILLVLMFLKKKKAQAAA